MSDFFFFFFIGGKLNKETIFDKFKWLLVMKGTWRESGLNSQVLSS